MKTIHFESIDSTSTYLKHNYQNLDNFTFVSADYQTQGHGRNNRIWKSENGINLLFSLLLTDKNYFAKFKSISIVSAYSIVKTLESFGLKNLSIKWPNDVYASGKKITGILLESVSTNEMECLVVGIGINVNQKEFEGIELRQPTSMYLELGNKETDLNLLKEKVYTQIEKDFKDLINGKDFYPEIIRYDYLKGQEVFALINNEKKKIKVLGIDKDFRLKVISDDKEISLETGEVSFHV